MPSNFPEFQKWCAALCAFREARGEYAATSGEGIMAIINVIANRARLEGVDWDVVIFKKWQFSSMTAPNDPELEVVPVGNDTIFAYCYRIADHVWNGSIPDNTEGATHYFNPNVVLPSWTKDMVKIKSIGHHDFYKVK